MGYFANGTEGIIYREKYCDNCIHNEELEDCLIWSLHLNYNYELANKKNSFLNYLIPRKNGINLKCEMFKKEMIKNGMG